MRKLLLLVLIIGCNTSPTEVSTNAKKDNSDSATIVHQKKENKTSYKSLKEALLNPDKVDSLSIEDVSVDTKHLPMEIGKLISLKVLGIHCLENLEDLPPEIGNLKSLEVLDMNEGNGCTMNVSIPASIGNLTNLKELILDGALDAEGIRHFDSNKVSSVQLKMKELPQTIVKLQNLEVLDLGRNGIKVIPPWVFSLGKLKVLGLDYNEIHEIPSLISNLTNLQELSIISGDTTAVKLPECLKNFKGLKISLGRSPLHIDTADNSAEKKLRKEFPNISFSFQDLD